MPTFSLTLDAARERTEDLSAELFDAGASGVEVRDGEGTPMPGVAQPAPGRALLVAFFDERGAAEEARASYGGELLEIADEDWGEAWKKGLGPLAVGRAFVRPSWKWTPVPPGMAEIVLDPGMAFGTGNHPTTSLCLGALSALLDGRPGASCSTSAPARASSRSPPRARRRARRGERQRPDRRRRRPRERRAERHKRSS